MDMLLRGKRAIELLGDSIARTKRLNPALYGRMLENAMFPGARQQAPGVPMGGQELGNVPDLQQLMSFMNIRPDAVEAVRQPLYDRLIYPTAGTIQLRFFQLPLGQGVTSAPGGAAGVKTLDDTNMESAGQLPSPKAFLATAIEVIFEAGSTATSNIFAPQPPFSDAGTLTVITVGALASAGAANDVFNVISSGNLDLFIISKSYLQNARLDSFPPHSYPCVDAALATSAATTGIACGLTRAVGRPFYINPPVLLMPNTNFVVTTNWSVAVATPSGFNGRIMVRLDGFLYRNAQ